MTDLASAQLVEQLGRAAFDRDADEMRHTVAEILEHMAAQETREGRMWRRVPKNLLARIEVALARKDTLIEQQAEQIAQLTTTTAEDKRHMDKQAEQIAEWRKAIEYAPHDYLCETRRIRLPINALPTCRCWKSNALPEKETL